MNTSFDPSTVEGRVRAFEHFAARLESNARAQRALDAERLSILHEAVAFTRILPQAGARELEYRAMRSELAAVLRVSEYRIEREMSLAFTLLEQYPAVAEALRDGSIDLQHARVIADAGCAVEAESPYAHDDPVTREHREQYEAAALKVAERETPNRLKPAARCLAEQCAVTSLDERHRRAVTRRAVFVVDRDDGMADLIAHLPAPEAYAIKDRLTRVARVVARGETLATGAGSAGAGSAGAGSAEAGSAGTASARARAGLSVHPRTRGEIRADVLRDLLLAEGAPAAADVHARIQLVIPGDFGSVSELVGYGPVSTGSALEYATETRRWDRVKLHPVSGEVLSVDRYRPSEEMRRLLAARDMHCRFPGCRVPTSRCDIDHTVDAALGGPTATDNLAHLCRGHHTLKHHGGWQVRQRNGGLLEWTSPGGRRHLDRPPHPLPGFAVDPASGTAADPPAADPLAADPLAADPPAADPLAADPTADSPHDRSSMRSRVRFESRPEERMLASPMSRVA